MRVPKIQNNNYNQRFRASLTLKHSFDIKDTPILTNNFVEHYSEMVSKLGKPTDTVKIDVHPYSGGWKLLYDDYVMKVEVTRNNETHKKASGLLLCPDIKKDLPKILESEYKWLTCWFKDKNGLEKSVNK